MSHLNINGVDKPLDHVYVKARTENLYYSAETDWEIGILDDDGNPTGSTTSHYTKNFTAVEPETAYYLSGTIYIAQSGHRIYYYDANKNWISRSVLLEYYNGNFTTPANCKYVRFQITVDLESTSDWMLNTGSTALPYQPYLITKDAWEARDKNDHFLWGRTDTFTGASSISVRGYGLPVKSWEIDGNSQQSGTPAPDDPIDPEFVGVRTGNLFSSAIEQGTIRGTDGVELNSSSRIRSGSISVQSGASYAISSTQYLMLVVGYSSTTFVSKILENITGAEKVNTITIPDNVDNVRFVWKNASNNDDTTNMTPSDISNIMLNTGSTAKPYEPYGYKLTITSAGQTRAVYLGSVQTTRRVKKLVLTGDEDWIAVANRTYYITNITDYLRWSEVPISICSHYKPQAPVLQASQVSDMSLTFFRTTSGGFSRLYIRDTSLTTVEAFKTYLADQYAAGTPVTVWYVLANEQTGIVNEPLAKIGDYADTLTSEQAGITIPTTNGSTTISVDTSLAPSKFEIKVHAKPIHYGFKINKSVSDPSNAVIYTHDAVTMTPAGMDFTNGVFDYGSWENVWFIKNARPVMLNFDGTEAYDIDPNDYSKKLDGTASDIADSTKSMNAMIAFPTVWIKRTDDGSYNYIEISDRQLDSDFHAYAHENASGVVQPYIYLPIFKGSMVDGKLRSISGVKPQSGTTAQQEVDAASALGTGWQIWDYTSKEMLCDLLTLISKSLDTQGKVGQGHSTGGSSASDFLNCGTLNDKGKFFGYSATTSQVKCFGMEALWAERWDRELGLILDAGIYKIKEHPAYNLTGEGYTAISTSVAKCPTSNNYIKTEVSTQFGSLPTVVGGTQSTYYCDYFYQNQSGIRVALRGGSCNNGAYAGLRFVYVNFTASNSYWNVGASPVYKPS